jgi:hypothetical protein
VRDRPLVFVGPMWRDLRRWVEEQIVAPGLASAEDLTAVHWVDDIDAALRLVEAARNDFLRHHEIVLPPVGEEAPS